MRILDRIGTINLKTLMFDIDGTLCNQEENDYMKATPFIERIKKINDLSKNGIYVKLFTSRGITSGKDWTIQTRQQLDNWGLNYDELIFGKPHYDLFIDDKSVNSEDFPWAN